MAKNYEVKAKVDMSQHDAALKRSSFEIYKYEKNIKAAQGELNRFSGAVNGTVGGLGNLASALGRGDFMGFANGLKNVIPSMTSLQGGLGGVGGALSSLVNPATLAAAGIAAVGAVVVESVKKVSEFETHLDSLQSLTGLDDSGIKAVSDAAIEMSKSFPASASAIVDSMKLIGSQAPELLKDKDALIQVTQAANTLAGAAQIEVVDAAKAITTTMNQMGVSGEKAGDIINVLAAASQQGSADVAYLSTAFEKAGTAAASAGMNYTQLAAMVESVAPKFSSADVAGSQLASTMLKLSTQANDNFKPAVVGMQQALDNLAKAQLNDAELKKLVGESNITMVKSLIAAKDQFAAYSQSLAGTNTAQEQFATNTDNLQGAIQKLKNTWDAFLLTLGQSGIIQGIIASIQQVIKFVGDLINEITDTVKVFDLLGTDSVKNVNILALQLKVVGEVIHGLCEVVRVVVAILIDQFNKCAQWIADKWAWVKSCLNGNGMFSGVLEKVYDLVRKFVEYINQIRKAWNDMKRDLGLGGASSGGNGKPAPQKGGKSFNEMTDDEKRAAGYRLVRKGKNKQTGKYEEVWTNEPETPKLSGGGGGGKGKGNRGGGAKTTSKATPKAAPFDADSIAAYESNIREWNEQLKKQNLTLDEQAQIIEKIVFAQQELDKLRSQQESLKAEIEVSDKFGADIVEKYKQATGNLSLDPDFFKGVTTRKEAEQRIQEFLNSMKPKLPVDVTLKAPKLDTSKVGKSLKKKTDELKFDGIGEGMKAIQTLSGAFSTLGGAIGDTTEQMLEFVATAMSGIAEMIPAIVSLIGAKQGEATASGVASAAALPFPANLGAIATIISVITSIFASLASFAEGGIVQGASRIGDYNIARVNGGEMILNGQQQANLWKAVSSNRLGGDGGTLITSDVKIKGSDIYLALSNYSKVRGKSGHKVTL